MNTRQLSYILAIAEHGSLSKAAKVLGVSQPALSKYLSELEDSLGTELFLRHKKHLYPTSAGSIYLEAASRIIAVKDQTYQTIADLTGGHQKTLTIGVTPLRGSIAIAQIFNQFHSRYPNVRIELKENYMADLRQAVIDHKVDLALGTCIDPDANDLIHTSFHEEDMIVFLPSFHPAAAKASRDLQHLNSIDISDLQDTPFLIGKTGSTIRQMTDIIFEQNRIHPTIIYEANNNLILKHMAENGSGAALLTRGHLEPSKNLVYFTLRPNYSVHLTVMAARDHHFTEEERYLMALNYITETKNLNYRFNPNKLALDIIQEFHLDHLEEKHVEWTPRL